MVLRWICSVKHLCLCTMLCMPGRQLAQTTDADTPPAAATTTTTQHQPGISPLQQPQCTKRLKSRPAIGAERDHLRSCLLKDCPVRSELDCSKVDAHLANSPEICRQPIFSETGAQKDVSVWRRSQHALRASFCCIFPCLVLPCRITTGTGLEDSPRSSCCAKDVAPSQRVGVDYKQLIWSVPGGAPSAHLHACLMQQGSQHDAWLAEVRSMPTAISPCVHVHE